MAHRTMPQRLSIGITAFVLNLPITFVVEEVSFRGPSILICTIRVNGAGL